MIDNIINPLIRFVVLIMIQVLILNNIKLTTLEITPYVYLIFILSLSTDIEGWVLLLIGFVTGFVIDLFSNTLGLHTSASVFMAALRPISLNLNASRTGYENNNLPNARFFGSWWFFKYSFGLIVAHHLLLFFVDEFGFVKIHLTLLKVLFSAVLTFIVVFIAELIIHQRNIHK